MKISFKTLALPLLTLASLVGCTEPNPDYQPKEPVCDTANGVSYLAESVGLMHPNKVDIVFVVENGPGMAAQQNALATAMPAFVSRLVADTALDWHLAVTTTDLADGGAFKVGGAGDRDCVSTVPKQLDRTVTNVGVVAACAVRQGEAGSAFPQPFAAAQLAINGTANVQTGGPNAGFFRSDARLVVVFFGLHDDCTFVTPNPATQPFDASAPSNCIAQKDRLSSLADVVGFFDARFRDRTQRPAIAGDPVSLVVIGGPTGATTTQGDGSVAPACTSLADAYAADRLAAVANAGALRHRSLVANICTRDFGPVLDNVFDATIAPSDEGVCLTLAPVGDPVGLWRIRAGQGTSSEPLLTSDELISLGSDAACATSRVGIPASALEGSGTDFEIRYCAVRP